MVTLKDLDNFVRDCHLDYAAAGIEVGNPSYEWDEAHHPEPGCLGGTKTVPLLRKDHAVHGVLQSEVFQHPCIYGWEATYLESELYDLCKKWHTEKTILAFHQKNEEGETPAELGREELHKKKNKDGKSIHAIKTLAQFYSNPEHQRNASLASHAKKNEEGKSLLGVENGKRNSQIIREKGVGIFSPEVRERSLEAARQANMKPVRLTNLETKEVYEFDSTAEAAKCINCSATNITAVLKGRNKSIKGYTASYV